MSQTQHIVWIVSKKLIEPCDTSLWDKTELQFTFCYYKQLDIVHKSFLTLNKIKMCFLSIRKS